jgi:hypothetical protein
MGQMFSEAMHWLSQESRPIQTVLLLVTVWLVEDARRIRRSMGKPATSRIDAKAERALRVALTSVARGETDQIETTFAGLDDSERAEAVALAISITSYVSVDACGSTWPTDASIRCIAKSLATSGTFAKPRQLDEDEMYTYLARVVLGSKRLEDVVLDELQRMRLPVIVAQRALAVLSPKELGLWDYLNRIESAMESASALDETVLAAAVTRAYMPRSEAFFQFHQDVHADDYAQKCAARNPKGAVKHEHVR